MLLNFIIVIPLFMVYIHSTMSCVCRSDNFNNTFNATCFNISNASCVLDPKTINLKIIQPSLYNLSENFFEVYSSEYSFLYIDLSDNNIKDIDLNAFNRFDSLKVLNLSLNNISYFRVNQKYNNQLSNIILSGNGIEELNADSFQQYQALWSLNLSKNRLKSVKGDFFSVKDLNLNYNQLFELRYPFFQSFPSLRNLYLRNNNLKSIDPRTFHILSELQYLTISNNDLKAIHPETFFFLFKLIHLDLSNNKITTLHQYTFQFLPSLQYLNISHNQIKNVFIDFLLAYSKSLQEVTLDNNLWDCQNLSTIIRTFQVQKILVPWGLEYGRDNVMGIACDNSEIISSTSKNLLVDEVEQIKTLIIVMIAIISCIFVIALFLKLFTVYRLRKSHKQVPEMQVYNVQRST